MVGKKIAVIPARGGSKRIPRKNIVDFGGRPMIAWTIEAALESGCFDRVLVSTDDNEIAEVACRNGAEVPFLRDHDLDDHAQVSSATIGAVRRAMDHYGEEYGMVAQLMASCPLRTAQDIHAGISWFESSGVSFLVSASRFGWPNPWWAATLDEAGHPTHVFDIAVGGRSQDLPPLYCASGALWLGLWPRLEEEGTFFGRGHIYFPMTWTAAVDIDDFADLEFATAIRGLHSIGTKSCNGESNGEGC